MIYLRARFYEPELNRFSQKDILRGSVIQPGSLNRYLYCQNDPVNYSDPSGMRQVAGIYGDGTGRTGTAKQTTPIITKPSQSKVSSAAAASRTVAVPVTDTGTGGNSATKKSSVINNVAASISSAASAADTINHANDNSAYAQAQRDREVMAGRDNNPHNSGISTQLPDVQDVTGEKGYSCERESQVREKVDSNLLLRLLLNTDFGGTAGFGISGGADISFAADKEGSIYALVTVGGGGGLRVTGKGNPVFNSLSGNISSSIFDSMKIVDSVDELDGWGVSIGGTLTIISAESRVIEQNDPDFNLGFSSFGLDFHAHIIYTWAFKIGEIGGE